MRVSKEYVRRMLQDEEAQSWKHFTNVLALVTVISIGMTASESVPRFAPYLPVFVFIEWITVILFTVEYGARIWVAEHKRAYMVSWMGLTDIASILPTYLGLGSFTFLKTARLIRATRLMRLIGRTNITHVRRKGEFLYERFELTPRVVFSTLIACTFACMLIVSSFDASFGFWKTLAIFVGGVPTPDIGGIFIPALILGRILGALTLGLFVGIVGKLFNEWILGKGK